MTKLDLPSLLRIPELPKYLKKVETALRASSATANPHIQQPLERIFSASGKRLRPALVIASALSQGKAINKDIISCGAAIELVHIASLVHDDIIDNANSRWNTPTINSQEGLGHALIIGDYLLAKAAEVAASISAEVAGVVAGAIASLCDGQSRELADQYNLKRTEGSLYLAIKGKTSALLAASCQVGALCAGLTDVQIAAFRQFGSDFGVSFQLIDDILDFLSTDELYGKPVGNDVREGNYTLPIVLSLQGSSAKALADLISKNTNNSHFDLVDVLINDGSIKRTVNEVKTNNMSAAKALKNIQFSDILSGLQDLPAAYTNWALTNLVASNYKHDISKILV